MDAEILIEYHSSFVWLCLIEPFKDKESILGSQALL
jgi:hypothetical protein